MTASAAGFSIGPELPRSCEFTNYGSHFECRHEHSDIGRSGGTISGGDEK